MQAKISWALGVKKRAKLAISARLDMPRPFIGLTLLFKLHAILKLL